MTDVALPDRAHAKLSPSSAYTWITCPASAAAQDGLPDSSSEAADDGTASHSLASDCLDSGKNTSHFLGKVYRVGEREFEVDDERAEYVQLYVDEVRNRVAAYELMGARVIGAVEQRLPIDFITGEHRAAGTTDAIIIATWPHGRAEMCVIDLKYGRGVEVYPDNNYQLMLYGAAALAKYGEYVDIDEVVLVIHQPRVQEKALEWSLSATALRDWVDSIARPAAHQALTLLRDPLAIRKEHFTPGEKQCRFCKANGTCKALAGFVESSLGEDLDALIESAPLAKNAPVIQRTHHLTLNELGKLFGALDLIELFEKSVRARIEAELLRGNTIPGVKLVKGRLGPRRWADEEAVAKALSGMHVARKTQYIEKLRSPAQLEKELRKTHTEEWGIVERYIVRRDGQPHVVAENDPRDALVIEPLSNDLDTVA